MKKKLIAGLLVAGMSISLVACGTNDTAQENPGTEVSSEAENVTEEASSGNEADEGADTENTEASEDTSDSADTGESSGVDDLGQALYASFVELDAANPSATAAELAEGLLENDFILFSGATMDVEPGYLTGFGNAEITGFEEGTMFAPMIGSIPFVGYVFVLADETDADSFVETLSENADPNWNICTQADETVIETAGNKVFFVMCPQTLDAE